MKLSPSGLELIRQFEGYHRALPDGRCRAYRCPANVWTIGYGVTEGVREGMVLTREEAEVMLMRELAKFEAGVVRLTTAPLNQNQFDALVSFTYNVGLGAFERSTLRKRINAGDYRGAAGQFKRWNRGGGRVLPGLVNRRAREATLFLTPVDEPEAPEMPQQVDPSPEPVSKPVIATVAAGGGAVIPAVPSVVTDSASNAATWQAAADQFVGMSKWAIGSPLALLIVAAMVGLLVLPKLVRSA